jgi:hypothetical protein
MCIKGRLSRSGSVSSLSSQNQSEEVTVADGGSAMFERLKGMSSTSNKSSSSASSRRARTRPSSSKEQLLHPRRQRSQEALKDVISRIKFQGDDDDCCSCNSTVSSLGVGLPDDEEEDDLLLLDLDDDEDGDDDDDSAARIMSQIKQLRRCSMERFQAVTPPKRATAKAPSVDSIPVLPISQSERILRGQAREAFWAEEQDVLTSLRCHKHVCRGEGDDAIDVDETMDFHHDRDKARASQRRFLPCTSFQLMERRGSLPDDLSLLTAWSTPASTKSSEEPSLSTGRPTREDRWSTGSSSDGLDRDCELVRRAFETIVSSHRSTTSTGSIAADTMLVPPVRRS